MIKTYTSKCEQIFDSASKLGGHSANCDRCKLLRSLELENKNKFCLICKNKLTNLQEKYCSQKCTAIAGGRRSSELGTYKVGLEKCREKLKEISKWRKGKTLEEIFGKEISNNIKEKCSVANLGKVVSQEIRDKISRTEKGRKITWGNKISKTMRGRKLSENHKELLRKNHVGMLGRKHSSETIKKMSDRKVDKNNPMFGKTMSAVMKRKMRISAINRIKETRGSLRVNIGKNETNLLNVQENMDNCKIQRAYHIEKLGYFVDGYCPETNTVYEVYEKFHDRYKNKLKDFARQVEIEDCLKCNFKIIRDL